MDFKLFDELATIVRRSRFLKLETSAIDNTAMLVGTMALFGTIRPTAIAGWPIDPNIGGGNSWGML